MSSSLRRPSNRARRHGAVLEPEQRRQLERDGWRTTLDYRENHVRGLDGRLLRVEPVWVAEAERYDGDVVVASAVGDTPDDAWLVLCDDIAAANVTRLRRVRLAAIR
jgi:hypothetical protein